jgi:hypothetical protein
MAMAGATCSYAYSCCVPRVLLAGCIAGTPAELQEHIALDVQSVPTARLQVQPFQRQSN